MFCSILVVLEETLCSNSLKVELGATIFDGVG